MLEKTVKVSNVTLRASQGDIWHFNKSIHSKEYLQTQWFDPSFSQLKTIEVSNISLRASEQDIMEFFQGCGDIEYVEMQSDNKRTQIAYVTFTNSRGAMIAAHQSGATMIDLVAIVTLKPNHMLPPTAFEPFKRVEHCALPTDETAPGSEDAGGEAGDVVSSILAVGQRLNVVITSLIATLLDAQEEFSKLIKALGEISREISEKTKVQDKEEMGKAVDGFAQVSKVEKAVREVSRKTEERVAVAEEKRKGKIVVGYAQILSESPKASAPSEPGACRPAKRRKLKRPIGWEKENLRR